MNAPNKLYISQLIYETWQYQTPDPDDNTEIVYIRKDALMDWLIEQRDNAASLDDQFVSNAIGEYEAYQETIDKLNEM